MKWKNQCLLLCYYNFHFYSHNEIPYNFQVYPSVSLFTVTILSLRTIFYNTLRLTTPAVFIKDPNFILNHLESPGYSQNEQYDTRILHTPKSNYNSLTMQSSILEAVAWRREKWYIPLFCTFEIKFLKVAPHQNYRSLSYIGRIIPRNGYLGFM